MILSDFEEEPAMMLIRSSTNLRESSDRIKFWNCTVSSFLQFNPTQEQKLSAKSAIRLSYDEEDWSSVLGNDQTCFPFALSLPFLPRLPISDGPLTGEVDSWESLEDVLAGIV